MVGFSFFLLCVRTNQYDSQWEAALVAEDASNVIEDIHAHAKEVVDGAEGFPGEPRDPSMLIDYGDHVAVIVWNEEGLISVFVEMWHKETSSFHLPIGELTITLDDVISLFHLPIIGTFHSFETLHVDEAILMLVDLLEVSREEARAEITQCCILFANKSATHVHVIFLNAFQDLSQNGSYGRGASALVHMYDHLNDACKSVQSLGSERTDVAYVTLLYGDEFLLGVRVLGKSIRDTGSNKDMVVLVSDGVSDYANTHLQADGWIVEKISLLANPNQVRPKRFWVVYFDADTIVVKNIEELLKCGKFCANLKHSERLNSGVMVVQPSATIFNDMMSKVKTLPSYTGGDQGFLNSYYSGFPNAHLFEPNLSPDMLDTRPVPEMERLSTLYNADVGLYMLANKIFFVIVGNNILIEVIKIKIMMFVIERLNELEEKLEGMEAIIEAWINVDEKLWMVDENELRVIHYTLGPLKPWDWWTSWLVKPVDVWQNVREQLEESLPGTGGGQNPKDNYLVKFLFLLPFCAVLFCCCRLFLKGFGSCEALAYSSDDWLINGVQYKVPAYLGSISVCGCLLVAVVSLGLSIFIVPRQVAPWIGLLLMYEWTFTIFFILFGGYLNLIYHRGRIIASQMPSSLSHPESSDDDSEKVHQRQMSSCDAATWFYGLGMAFLAIATPSLPFLFGITALFLRLALMVVGGAILACFLTYSSERLAIRSFLKGLEERDVARNANFCC
ncbi:Inositol phosphorylceramide glucuronosyltransferase 1 [Glycine soja]|uniref:Inositol phosphorylceramide glucuronosyltransferase 1 n=1 Tax=Glycine soja TaxID=3848 RepID=A0A445INF4_GLYSO|nr:Inositol phosphorylceramide glucuronosyltransferase 1 [Glycine soja]